MSTEFHEPRETLSTLSLDLKRAIDSMREELEAVDWYRQRAQGCADPHLCAILDHHQREEIEHFAMLLEWCRRHDADFAKQLSDYLFREGDIVGAERSAASAFESPERGPASPPSSGTIGSLKGEP